MVSQRIRQSGFTFALFSLSFALFYGLLPFGNDFTANIFGLPLDHPLHKELMTDQETDQNNPETRGEGEGGGGGGGEEEKGAFPHFILIGPRRTGSTSLARYIENHPNVCLSHEVKFWSIFQRSSNINMYRKAFAHCLDTHNTNTTIIGEKSSSYFGREQTVLRIRRVMPQVKIIITLRNPVDRALSFWSADICQYQLVQPSDNFSHLFESWNPIYSEIFAFQSPSQEQQQHPQQQPQENSWILSPTNMNDSELKRGKYFEHIQRWFELFPRKNIKIVQSEELFQQPKKVLSEVEDFLNLPHIHNYSERELSVSYGQACSKTQKTHLWNLVDKKEIQRYYQESVTQLENYLGQQFHWFDSSDSTPI